MDLRLFCIFLLFHISVCSAGRVEINVNKAVYAKPEIYQLFNITSSIDNNARITCKVKGRPPPKVTFRKLSNVEPYRPGIQDNDPRILLNQEFFTDKGEAFGTLMISNLIRSDDGLYQCIAENPSGSAYKNGHLTVWFKPTFNRGRDLHPVWSWDGRPGNLTCLPEAIPNATIVWRWNHIEISEENFNNGRIQRNNFQVINRGLQSVLIVKPYDRLDLYSNYECIAQNPLGVTSNIIQLKRGTVPTAVNQAKAHTVTPTTIKFEIVPPMNFDGLPIRTYSVQYKSELQPSWDTALTHTWSHGSPYILEHLIPELTYHMRFAAENDVGRGSWSNVWSYTTPRLAQPAEPTLLVSSPIIRTLHGRQEVASPYSNLFDLRWNVPSDNGKPIEYYLIRYCTIERVNDNYRDRDCSENIQQSVQYTNYQLERLMPDTMYKVELRAHNAIGDSSPAQVWVRTASASGLLC